MTYDKLEQEYRRAVVDGRRKDPRSFFVWKITAALPWSVEFDGRDSDKTEELILALTEFAEKNGIPFDPVMFLDMFATMTHDNPAWHLSEICY